MATLRDISMSSLLDPRSGAQTAPEMGSERNFGLVFAAVFTILALLPLIRGQEAHLWLLPIAATFFAAAFLAPRILRPLNRLWYGVGLLLGKIVTPLVMVILWLA